MYQWGVLQEQIDVWEQENRPMSEAERQRIEFLAEQDEQRPSLLDWIAGIFRAEPEAEEPLIARSLAEAELIGVLPDWDGARSNSQASAPTRRGREDGKSSLLSC